MPRIASYQSRLDDNQDALFFPFKIETAPPNKDVTKRSDNETKKCKNAKKANKEIK
jgi:hypothetical protein